MENETPAVETAEQNAPDEQVDNAEGGTPADQSEGSAIGEQSENASADNSDGDDGEQIDKKQNNQKFAFERLTHKIEKMSSKLLELENENLRLRSSSHGSEGTVPEAPAIPDRGDYADDETYNRAVFDYNQRLISSTVSSQVEKAVREREANASWERQVEELKKTVPDANDVLADAADVRVHDDVNDALRKSNHGAEIMYHILKDQSLRAKITRVSGYDAFREIAKMDVAIESRKAKPVTKVGEPIKPIRSTGKESSDINSIESDREYFAKVAERKRREFEARTTRK